MMKNLLLASLGTALATTEAQPTDESSGQYIVRVQMEASNSEFYSVLEEFNSFAAEHGAGEVIQIWPSFNMFAVEMLSDRAMSFLQSHAKVNFVVESRSRHIMEYSWGIDRLDQSALPLSDSYTPNFNGFGVDVYVVDTGLDTTHVEFSAPMTREVENVYDYYGNLPNTNNDAQGHGSHCAGTIGGNTTGVSRMANIYGVRVLNDEGSGTSISVVSGLEYVFNRSFAFCHNPMVVSMSLGGTCDDIICERDITITAIDDYLTPRGIVTVVAAGNEHCDACFVSPAASITAITVAATNISDGFAYFSNYGQCIDMMGPGVNITSVCASGSSFQADGRCFTNGDGNEYLRISGTSMATPHVAGVAAQWLQASDELELVSFKPRQVKQAMQCTAVPGTVYDVLADYTKNKLLQIAPVSTNASLPSEYLCNRGNDPNAQDSELSICPMSCMYNETNGDSNGVCDTDLYMGCICDKVYGDDMCMTDAPYQMVCDVEGEVWMDVIMFNVVTGDGWNPEVYYQIATHKGAMVGDGSLGCNVAGADQYCLKTDAYYNFILCVPEGVSAGGANATLSGCPMQIVDANTIYSFVIDAGGECAQMMATGTSSSCTLPNTGSSDSTSTDEAGLIGGLVGGLGGGLLLIGAGWYMCVYTKKKNQGSSDGASLLSPGSRQGESKYVSVS